MRTEPLMNLGYQPGKDGMLYPKLQISTDIQTDQVSAGRFGGLWKDYMMEEHPHRLCELVAQGKINEMILQVEKEALQRKEERIQQLLAMQPMPETEDMMERAGHLAMITREAEESVINEVVLKIR